MVDAKDVNDDGANDAVRRGRVLVLAALASAGASAAGSGVAGLAVSVLAAGVNVSPASGSGAPGTVTRMVRAVADADGGRGVYCAAM